MLLLHAYGGPAMSKQEGAGGPSVSREGYRPDRQAIRVLFEGHRPEHLEVFVEVLSELIDEAEEEAAA